MRRILKMTVLVGLPFGVILGLILALGLGERRGLLFGPVAGVVFGLLLTAFVEWQRSRFSRDIPDVDGEQLLKQGPANHFRGMESVGGWMYLTDRRLLFRSHRFNVQNHECSFPLGEIREAHASLTAGIIPNGLRVMTAQGQERFVVEGRRTWVQAIDEAKEQLT